MRFYFWLAAATLALVLPFCGAVHLFDWDEINFAEAAREMLVRGNYIQPTINFLPFWEKPPLFFWMQAAAMHLFGVGEFAARFPNAALCSVATVCTLAWLGKRLQGPGLQLWWPLVYLGSVLPQFYLRSGLIDPWWNLLIFWSLLGLFFHTQARQRGEGGWAAIAFGGLAAGLAVLTKGPVALLLIGLTAFFYWALVHRFRIHFAWAGLLLFAGLAVLVPGLWVGAYARQYDATLLEQFTAYQTRLAQTEDAGHGGFPGYHVVVLLFGCFPASFLFIRALTARKPGQLLGPAAGPTLTHHQDLHAFWPLMQILFWVVLVVFSIVKSKIVHYSSLCYPPLTFGAALAVQAIVEQRLRVPGYAKAGWILVGSILGLACLAFPLLAHYAEVVKPLLAEDPFAQANLDALADMHFTGLEPAVGLWAIGVPCMAIALLNRARLLQAMWTLFGGTALTVMLVLWAYIGRAEALSQGAAIAWQQGLQGKQGYVLPLGYRSYAPMFYAQLRPEQAPNAAYAQSFTFIPDRWADSLLTQPSDRPVYVISKVTEQQTWQRYPLLQETGRRNGFVFLKKAADIGR